MGSAQSVIWVGGAATFALEDDLASVLYRTKMPAPAIWRGSAVPTWTRSLLRAPTCAHCGCGWGLETRADPPKSGSKEEKNSQPTGRRRRAPVPHLPGTARPLRGPAARPSNQQNDANDAFGPGTGGFFAPGGLGRSAGKAWELIPCRMRPWPEYRSGIAPPGTANTIRPGLLKTFGWSAQEAAKALVVLCGAVFGVSNSPANPALIANPRARCCCLGPQSGKQGTMLEAQKQLARARNEQLLGRADDNPWGVVWVVHAPGLPRINRTDPAAVRRIGSRLVRARPETPPALPFR